MTAPATTTVERTAAISTLLLAFSLDPIIRWLWPDVDDYRDAFGELVRLEGAPALAADTVDVTQHAEGAAVWNPPGTSSDEDAVVDLIQRSLPAHRLDEVFDLFEQADHHHPREAHWYLPFIDIDPDHQRQGHGSSLLEHGLARCDRDRLPAYLEASTPRNRALYERYGFEVTAELKAGDSPPLWPMLRAPR